MTRMRWVPRALSICLICPVIATASITSTDTTQFCWVKGMKDNTIYYAEATGREDRSASFADLMTISGIEHTGPICFRDETELALRRKADLLVEWLDAEWEVVNTTYMSDMDF